MEQERHSRRGDPWHIWPHLDRSEAGGVDLGTVKLIGALLGLLFGMPACIGVAAFLVLTFGFWALGAAMLALLLGLWTVGKVVDARAARRRLEDERVVARARGAREARRLEDVGRRAPRVRAERDEVEQLDRRLEADFHLCPGSDESGGDQPASGEKQLTWREPRGE